MRVAVVAVHPAPYREHVLSRLASEPEWKVRVFYSPDVPPWKKTTPSYDAVYLDDKPWRWFSSSYMLRYIGSSIFSKLKEFRPEAVVCYGYDSWPMQGAILWAQREGVPLILRNDANCFVKAKNGRRFRRFFLGKWFRVCGARALAIGVSNEEYWIREMGFDRSRIFWAPYTVDNMFLETAGAEWRPRRGELHARWGTAGKRVVLYVGRLSSEKGLPVLLGAFARMRARRSNSALVLVGSGPEESRLKKIVSEQRIPDVVFCGFVEPDALPPFYAAADVFVLPSLQESWGLVVNEAMASGLPVVVSREVGAWPDLVQEGENGFVVPAGDQEALADTLLRVLDNSYENMGKRSKEIIRAYSVERELQGFREALRAARNDFKKGAC